MSIENDLNCKTACRWWMVSYKEMVDWALVKDMSRSSWADSSFSWRTTYLEQLMQGVQDCLDCNLPLENVSAISDVFHFQKPLSTRKFIHSINHPRLQPTNNIYLNSLRISHAQTHKSDRMVFVHSSPSKSQLKRLWNKRQRAPNKLKKYKHWCVVLRWMIKHRYDICGGWVSNQ